MKILEYMPVITELYLVADTINIKHCVVEFNIPDGARAISGRFLWLYMRGLNCNLICGISVVQFINKLVRVSLAINETNFGLCFQDT